MNVLITGGLGVNGAVTARLMVNDGLRPVLMDNRMDLTLMGDIKDQVDIVIGDICDQDALEKAVDDYQVTHIAHLAALMPEPAEANPRLGDQGRRRWHHERPGSGARKEYQTGCLHQLESSLRRNNRRICAADLQTGARGLSEATGGSLWRSKVCCEELGRYYRETYGIEFIALRFVSIYGPGKEARHGPLSFYGQLIERARSGEKWEIPQGGDQLNDAVYVGDVGRAVYLALKASTPKALDVQHRHRQSVDAAGVFASGGQAISQSQHRARSRSE